MTDATTDRAASRAYRCTKCGRLDLTFGVGRHGKPYEVIEANYDCTCGNPDSISCALHDKDDPRRWCRGDREEVQVTPV